MTYSGDILLRESDGDIDATFVNGQPSMTEGFESAVILAVFGNHNTWQNAIAATPEEKYVSTFPDVIDSGRVDEATKNNGIEAIKRALKFLVDIKAAEKVVVTGEIVSVYAIGWQAEIYKPGSTVVTRYRLNWDKGILTTQFKEAT